MPSPSSTLLLNPRPRLPPSNTPLDPPPYALPWSRAEAKLRAKQEILDKAAAVESARKARRESFARVHGPTEVRHGAPVPAAQPLNVAQALRRTWATCFKGTFEFLCSSSTSSSLL